MSISALSRPVGCNHLCAPADIEACRSRLCEYADYWVKTGHATRLINMMNVVPQASLQQDATLSLHCLAALACEQRFEQADLFLSQWLIHIRQLPHDDPETFSALRNNLTGYVVLLQTLRSDLSLISQDTILHLKQTLDIPCLHQAMLNNIYAYLLYMNGKYVKAQQYAARAYHHAIATDDWFARAIAVLLQCVCDRSQGRFDIAYKSVLAAMQAYQVVNDSPAWAVLALVRAMFEYENNQLATAESLLNTAIPRLAMSAISDFRVNAYITLARVHASRDNFAAAESVLGELSDLISEGNDKRWMNYIVHEQIRVALLAGKPDFQARWQKKFPYMQRESSGALRTKYCPAVGHVPERTQLMLALQQRNLEVAERALGQLAKISSLHSDSFLRVVVLSGSAALEFCQENHDQAIVFLNEALALCRQANLYRTLFDENFLFAEVFQLARSLGRVDEDINSEWLQRLKEERFPRPRITKPSTASAAEPSVDSLTDTEIKVLDLLAQGLSNKDISRRMGIAVTTTKWHLKNIFSKLAANNRVGALIRARELHLLSVAGEALQLLPSTLAALAVF